MPFLYSYAKGIVTDDCSFQYGIRFENNQQAQGFMFQLAEEVARRLDAIEMRGRSLTLKIMKRDPKAPVEPPKVSHSLLSLRPCILR